MGESAKERWVRVMRRNYPPLFAFLICSTISRIFGKVIAVYKSGVYYWYITTEVKKSHGKDICKKWIDNNYIKSRYDNDIALFDREVADIQKLMNEYSILRKNGKPSHSHLLNVFKKVVDNYGIIFETTYGPYYYAEPELEHEIIKINGWPEDTVKDTKTIYHLLCKLKVGNLTIRGTIPKSHYPKKELLNMAIKLRRTLSQRILDIASEIGRECIPTIVEKGYSPYRITEEIEKRVREELALLIQSLPEIKEYVDRYSWISCGWHTGKPLTEKMIAIKCVDYMLGTPQPEILLEQNINVYRTLEEKRKAQILELQQKGSKKGISFEESGLKYADIIMYDGFIREARRVAIAQIDFLTRKFMQDIASSIGMDEENDLYFLSEYEIIESLKAQKNIVKKSVIKERSKQNFILFENGKIEKMVSNSDEVTNECCIRKLSYREPPNQIQGVVYTEWKHNQPVKGKPILIEKALDLFEITGESIVISEMIEPQQSIFLENARGIITEDGNPSCHAVHVTVAKGIPLIVGAEGIIELAIKAQDRGKEIRMHTSGLVEAIE